MSILTVSETPLLGLIEGIAVGCLVASGLWLLQKAYEEGKKQEGEE